MTPPDALEEPAKPICLTCISAPAAGALLNVSTFSTTLYALTVPSGSFGYWTTPSIVTNTLRLSGGLFDKLNAVVLAFPVNLSMWLSDISKVTLLFVSTWAQYTSPATGAC